MKVKQTSNSPTFISSLAEEIISLRNDYNYSDFTVIFPTRRAALIFKITFAQQLHHASLLPSVYSISDFIAHYTPQRIVEKKELLLQFYTIYKKHFSETDFRTFAPWGEMILSDFDEADRYLIDHQTLFADLKSYKEIESLFQDDEQQAEQLRKFFAMFLQEPTKLQQKFAEIWNKLPLLYEELFSQLQAENKTTEGHAMNKMALSPETYFAGLNTSTTVFAGFYALTPAEKNIFEFVQQRKGLIRWDADEYYVDSPDQEAGLFFRNNTLIQKEFKHKSNLFRTLEKNVRITGVPLVTGQVKYMGQQLKKMLKENKLNPDKTAIVLNDESLLPQVLQSIPEEIEELNITMGYPYSNTQMFRFVHLLEELKRMSVIKGKKTLLHFQSFLHLLQHPYSALIPAWMNDNTEGHGTYIPMEELIDDAKYFLEQWLLNENVFEKHLAVYNKITVYLQSVKSGELNVAAFMLNELEELNALTNRYKNILDYHSQEMLIEELYNTTRIPFSGEPVKGLQIMGFLETRVLDFENIFVLNANEGSLPKTNRHHSFIPYTLRKSFNLPTYTEQDAISAYHFWRLLQRASHIELLYNTQTNEFAGGERSRYLLQLFYEIKSRLSNWKISHELIIPPLQKINYINPEIKRSEELTKELKKLYNTDKLKFSATSLQSFIYCSLQFYFSYIKKIKEPDSFDEEIDGAVVGEILHQAIQNLYDVEKNKTFNKKDAALMKKKIQPLVLEAIRQKFDKHYQHRGYTFIIEKIIEKYIERIVDTDLTLPPFEIIETEKSHEVKLTLKDNVSATIKGKFDRIDKTAEGFRIVDYKTGKDELQSKYSIEQIFSEPKYKINLQLMLYNWLAERSNYNGSITSGIYPLRSISSKKLETISPSDWRSHSELFDFSLKRLLEEIIFEADFVQTQDLKRCSLCAYKDICNR
ncbi:MAG: PD-(D/E)XK nuclease superfamily protein [Bacteroidetes bacterium ADurb.Bin141]|nr:hypothetical protein [Bacteroidia bacterium]MBX3105038.1 PD-(D/E)XK nuclease family protein [Bacteroidota bacterium]MCB8929916.1 PD-(D/E)XK nuclease family protein [Bacteroidia bacterium]MCW5930744.1 PD-(D/E)XK nuclease family protein [Bacteroidota bacterium]OQB65948.1 MAG: PD-(D/E)XK nuclease superfamily protein [Bacteroidetes bacterium ADurb.Bin141]